jgi:hypothetical protein
VVEGVPVLFPDPVVVQGSSTQDEVGRGNPLLISVDNDPPQTSDQMNVHQQEQEKLQQLHTPLHILLCAHIQNDFPQSKNSDQLKQTEHVQVCVFATRTGCYAVKRYGCEEV